MTVSDECRTPPNLITLFLNACYKVYHIPYKCQAACKAFTSAFGYKDPNTVTGDDYNDYFDLLPIYSPRSTSQV